MDTHKHAKLDAHNIPEPDLYANLDFNGQLYPDSYINAHAQSKRDRKFYSKLNAILDKYTKPKPHKNKDANAG